ncbi:MAG: nuclear transport factor 2 family protein, partial [Bacteroidia bacterium]|nr:nuclear transport factor 2 family protein [Bacteroidia bacterium]
MRKLFFIGLVALLVAACQQEQRYFAESAEIETLKAGITAYESADWEKWKSHFSDTAKIYVNSTASMTLAEREADLGALTSAWGEYGFDKTDDHIEMVLDKNDETWVYYWATHNGTIKASGKKLALPVHLAVRFAEGKIVAEHVYFDTAPINAAMA